MVGEVQPLKWDSDWLGFRVARLVVGITDSAAGVVAGVRQSRAAGIRLLYLVLDPTDAAAAAAARATGAWPADHKLTYQLLVSEPGELLDLPGNVCIEAVEALTPQLAELARQSGEYSRFRRDPRIGPRAFDELYVGWLRQILAHGTVWAAATAGQTMGLLAFDVQADHARIELLAVAASARRQHIGQQLVQRAQQEASRRGFGVLRVVTQGLNQPARQFYERCGFSLWHTEQVYHLWL